MWPVHVPGSDITKDRSQAHKANTDRARRVSGVSSRSELSDTYRFHRASLHVTDALAYTHIWHSKFQISVLLDREPMAVDEGEDRLSTYEATEAGSASGRRHGKRPLATHPHSGAAEATGCSQGSVEAAMGEQRKPL